MPPLALQENFPKRQVIAQRQSEALRTLLRAILPDNPFYNAKYEAARAPGKVSHLGDFYGSFPFTTKAELIADQAAHPPYGTNLTYPLERYTRCHQTSGTSGAPLRWLDTPENWEWMLGNWQAILRVAGVTRADAIFFAFSFGPFIGFWLAFEAAARLGCRCLSGGGMSSGARLREILDQRATVLCCTPTYALHLAEVAAREGLSLAESPVKTIIVAGEPGGSIPGTRARLEALWPGARIFDHHGMTETGPVTYECPIKPRVLHVLENAYVAEIIDPATGAHVATGDTGELVLTTLGRLGSPLLRYRTGDLVRAALDNVCSCGRSDLALEGGILGRTDDMVCVRGVNLYPSAVEGVVRARGGVAEYQVRIDTGSTLPEISLELEPLPEVPDAAALARDLESALQTAFNLRIPVTAVAPGSLPRFEMKAQRWVRGE
jgi:phenylacetate-CoA ligase